MPSSPSTKARGDIFICDSGMLGRNACAELPFYKEHEGKQYCVLHYPGNEKSADFDKAWKRKINAKDYNFRGVWFPNYRDFEKFSFNESVDFTSAIFNAGVNFGSVTFNGDADFSNTTFSAGAFFGFATFAGNADFSLSRFSAEASFNSATFNTTATFTQATFDADADFVLATFNATTLFESCFFNGDAVFDFATFKDYVRFGGTQRNQGFGDNARLSLCFASIEKPDRISFHTGKLRPYWFVYVDMRKFEFVDVNWNWRSIQIKQEVRSILNIQYDLPAYPLLAIACRNLAVNAEENHRYEEASRFRYMAMETRRLERWRGFVPWRLSWWYWLASGYGELVWRAFVMLIGVWLMAAALYTGVGFVRWEPRVSSEQEAWEAKRDEVGQPLRWQRALSYSLGVMILQKPEPRPATDAAQAVVMLETILGPVQAALLALAIRRKFMR